MNLKAGDKVEVEYEFNQYDDCIHSIGDSKDGYDLDDFTLVNIETIIDEIREDGGIIFKGIGEVLSIEYIKKQL
jgi:hypothetical protein